MEQFPPIILNYTNLATRSDNVKHYEIVADQVTNEGDLSLPLNASSIIGMVIGKIKRHTGVFVLFTQKEQRVLMFSSWTTQFDSTLICPPSEFWPLSAEIASYTYIDYRRGLCRSATEQKRQQ
jgi:hypothetical protein